jgi:hypothetical protein
MTILKWFQNKIFINLRPAATKMGVYNRATSDMKDIFKFMYSADSVNTNRRKNFSLLLTYEAFTSFKRK